MGELQFYQRNLQRRTGVSTQPWATPWEGYPIVESPVRVPPVRPAEIAVESIVHP